MLDFTTPTVTLQNFVLLQKMALQSLLIECQQVWHQFRKKSYSLKDKMHFELMTSDHAIHSADLHYVWQSTLSQYLGTMSYLKQIPKLSILSLMFYVYQQDWSIHVTVQISTWFYVVFAHIFIGTDSLLKTFNWQPQTWYRQTHNTYHSLRHTGYNRSTLLKANSLLQMLLRPMTSGCW